MSFYWTASKHPVIICPWLHLHHHSLCLRRAISHSRSTNHNRTRHQHHNNPHSAATTMAMMAPTILATTIPLSASSSSRTSSQLLSNSIVPLRRLCSRVQPRSAADLPPARPSASVPASAAAQLLHHNHSQSPPFLTPGKLSLNRTPDGFTYSFNKV